MLKKLGSKRGVVVTEAIIVMSFVGIILVRSGVKGYYKNPVPKAHRNNASEWYRADVLKP